MNGSRKPRAQVDLEASEEDELRRRDARAYEGALPFGVHMSPVDALDNEPICGGAHLCPAQAAVARETMARGYSLSYACGAKDVACALSAFNRTIQSFRLRAGFDSRNERLILWFGPEPSEVFVIEEEGPACRGCSDRQCPGHRQPCDGTTLER